MNDKKSVWRTLALITQLGISMLTPLFLCVYIGWLLDKKFGWHTLIPLMILGFIAGARNVYSLVKTTTRENDRDNQT